MTPEAVIRQRVEECVQALRMKDTLVSGLSTDVWLRWTACLRLIKGVWVVVHGHVSVPADLASGRAVLDLQPA